MLFKTQKSSRLVDHDDQLENAAKFRAVNQQVATYDEFKATVDGCNLKVSRSYDLAESS